MSIFRSTIKPYLQRQISSRQDLSKLAHRSIDGKFTSYAAGRNAWVRMTSFVDYEGTLNGTNYHGSDLAHKYVLESGTLYFDPIQNKYSMRRGVAQGKSSVYGGNLGNREFGLRPMPGITEMNVHSKSAYGSLREATVKFYAWDKAQFEELEILFNRWGYSVLVEWGWSMYLDTYANDIGTEANANTINKIPLDKVSIKNFLDPTIDAFQANITPNDLYDRLEFLRHKFSGNYDGMLGLVRNFSWTMLPNGGFEVTAVIISIGDILDSLKINSSTSPFGVSGSNNVTPEVAKTQTRFEQVFTPLIDLQGSSLYAQDNLVGKDIAKDYESKFPNIDTDISTILFGNFPSGLFGKNYKNQLGALHYMSTALFLEIMNVQFNLFDSRGKTAVPLLNLEVPYPGYGVYGNGLCLASKDTVSIDPEVCMIRNPHAKVATGIDQGFDPKTVKGQSLPNAFHFKDSTSHGIIGNIYLCIENIIAKFKNFSGASDGYVDMKKFIKSLFEDVAVALGSINDFDFFVLDSNVALIDSHFMENPDTAKNPKYVLNVLGSNSILRATNIQSKIFESQASMVAIAAGVRENLTGVQSSTVNFLNRGMTDRLKKNVTDKDGIDILNRSTESDPAKQDLEYKKSLGRMVIALRSYLQSFLLRGDISQVESQRQSANSSLNSLILKINTDANYRAVIPISAELTFDGISGWTIGEIFKLNPDALPREYVNKRLGLIVTGVANHIIGSDWTTTITTMACLLEDDTRVGETLSPQQIEDIVGALLAEDSVKAAEPANLQVLAYNNVIDLIVAIFGAWNPSAVKQVNDARGGNNNPISPFVYTFTNSGETKITGINFVNYPLNSFISTYTSFINFQDSTNFLGGPLFKAKGNRQYILNSFSGKFGGPSDIADMVDDLVTFSPDYLTLDKTNQNKIQTSLKTLLTILKGAPQKIESTPFNLQRLDNQGNPSLNISLSLTTTPTSNF